MELTIEKENEIKTRFNVECLRENQKVGVRAVCSGHDVFVGTKTGSGKSMIYECIPVILPDAIVVIVAPLHLYVYQITVKLRTHLVG